MFLSLFSIAQCVTDSYDEIFTTLKHKIDKLHNITKYATFYEFFNLSENCSDYAIKKAFRRLKKSSNYDGMKKDQYDELVMYGYSLLVNYRKAYDGFLRDSKFIFIADPINYKNYTIVVLISSILFLLFIDFLAYSLRYLRYLEKEESPKKNNKSSQENLVKSQKKVDSSKPPKMVTNRIYNYALGLIKKKN